MLHSGTNVLQVKTGLPIKILGWLGLISGLFIFIAEMIRGSQNFPFLGLLQLVLGILLIILSRSYLEINNESVVISLPHVRYCLSWDEVLKIETNKHWGLIAFQAHNKQLVMFTMLMEKKKNHLPEILETEAKKRSIEIIFSSSVPKKNINVKC